MTKVHIISDLHLEFNWYNHVQPECELVLIAGDLHPGGAYSKGIRWLKETFNVPVVYIAGNHEYYAYPTDFSSVDRAMDIYIQREMPNQITFLQNDVMTYKNIRIIGSTLWTNWDLYGTPEESMSIARRGMNDYFNCCYNGDGNFLKPEDTLEEHNKSVEFLIEELSKPWDGKTIVLTHHCPHPKSIHAKYQNDRLNPAFTSDLSFIIEKLEPDYWIHGHTHASFDYMIEKTRIICNPLGYVSKLGNMENPEFNPGLVIDV